MKIYEISTDTSKLPSVNQSVFQSWLKFAQGVPKIIVTTGIFWTFTNITLTLPN